MHEATPGAGRGTAIVAARGLVEPAARAEEALPITGFDAIEAVWRLLRLHGEEESPLQAFREAHELSGSAEALAEPLERAGIQARPALIEAAELPYLEPPTLLQLRDGTWIVLASRSRDSVRIETTGGTITLRDAELAPWLGGYALDLSPSLPAGNGVWDRLLKLVARHGRTVAMLGGVSLLLQGLALVVPELTGMVMNSALPDRAQSTLHLIAAGVVLVAAFQAGLGWIRERVVLYLVTRVEVSAERGLLQHVLRLPFPFLDGMPVGDRLQAVAGMSAARETVAERAVSAVLDGVMAIGFVAAMALKMPGPTVLVIAVAAAMAGLTLAVGSAQARHEAREMDAQVRERGYLTELISGIATIKAAGAEKRGLERWLARFRTEQRHGLQRQRVGLWSEVGLELLRQGLNAAVLVWGGKLALEGKLQVGTLFAFLQLSSGFLGSVFGVVNAWLVVAVLRPQLVRTREVLAQKPDRRAARRLAPSAPAVQVLVDDLWFRYGPESPWIAKGYSARFEAGGKHVITGPSGFGKSTILRMIAGLYPPHEGSISVGCMSPQAAAGEILYLPQFVNLFSGSIGENLRLLSGGAPIAQLFEMAERTGLAGLVETMPMGYHTVLSPGGRSVSGGQRQLIALTAALASGRKLLLLDEAMSNLDPIRARELRKLLEGMPATVIEARHVVA